MLRPPLYLSHNLSESGNWGAAQAPRQPNVTQHLCGGQHFTLCKAPLPECYIRYCTLSKWRSRLARPTAMNPTGFIMLDHYQYHHSCTRDEGDKATESQTIALNSSSVNQHVVEQLTLRLCESGPKTMAPLRSEKPASHRGKKLAHQFLRLLLCWKGRPLL